MTYPCTDYRRRSQIKPASRYLLRNLRIPRWLTARLRLCTTEARNLERGFAFPPFGIVLEPVLRKIAATTATLALGVAGLPAAPAMAAPEPVAEHGSFSILVENDVFYKSDRDYTSGVALAYTTG